MNKFLAIVVSLLLVTVDVFARAGSSHSRSSSHSSRASSSHSYSRPAPSYSRPAPRQTYQRPVYNRPAPVTRPTPVKQTVVVNKTTNITNNRSTNNRNNDNDGGGSGFGGGNNNGGGGGMGIGGTIMGVAGGIVAGNLLTSALMGDHRNDGHAPAGGYASTPQGYPVAGQPVAPAMAGAESGNYVTDGQGGFVQTPTVDTTQAGVTAPSEAVTNITPVQAEEDHWFLRFLGYTLTAFIVLSLLWYVVRKYMAYRARQNEWKDMMEAEQNLSKFEQIFKTVQSSYEAGSRVSLIKLCTPEMYDHIIQAKDGNEDQGLTNIIDEVQVHSLVNISSWVQDGVKFQQVKIRFSMIDYMIDETGEVTHGSKDKRETAVEYWTFSSSSKNDWVLSSIDQHGGYVHQI